MADSTILEFYDENCPSMYKLTPFMNARLDILALEYRPTQNCFICFKSFGVNFFLLCESFSDINLISFINFMLEAVELYKILLEIHRHCNREHRNNLSRRLCVTCHIKSFDNICKKLKKFYDSCNLYQWRLRSYSLISIVRFQNFVQKLWCNCKNLCVPDADKNLCMQAMFCET